MKKIDKIENLLGEVDTCRSLESLEYALYLTLTMRELCNAYFDNYLYIEVRDNIIKHILRKIEKDDENLSKRFCSKLIATFCDAEGMERISLGTTIKLFNKYFTKKQKIFFFKNQYLSEKLIDRRRAYFFAPDIFNDEIENDLWKSYNKYKDKRCLELLISFGNGNQLEGLFPEILRHKELKRTIKNIAITKCAKVNPQMVVDHVKNSPFSLLTAYIGMNEKISTAQAKSILSQAKFFGELQYGIWCLGKLGMIDELIEMVPFIAQLEKSFPEKSYI